MARSVVSVQPSAWAVPRGRTRFRPAGGWFPYLVVGGALFWYVPFVFYPVAMAIWMSLHAWVIENPSASPFVGLGRNYTISSIPPPAFRTRRATRLSTLCSAPVFWSHRSHGGAATEPVQALATLLRLCHLSAESCLGGRRRRPLPSDLPTDVSWHPILLNLGLPRRGSTTPTRPFTPSSRLMSGMGSASAP